MIRASMNEEPQLAGSINFQSGLRLELMHSKGVHGHRYESWLPVSAHKGFEITTLRRKCGNIICQAQAGIKSKDFFRFREKNKPIILAVSSQKAQQSVVERVHHQGLEKISKCKVEGFNA